MRWIIFFLCIWCVYSKPSENCLKNATLCTEGDFDISLDDKPCAYYEYDKAWGWDSSLVICDFPTICAIVPQDSKFVAISRQLNIGNGQDTTSELVFNTTISNLTKAEFRPKALLYYNRDICQCGIGCTFFWVGIIVVGSILALVGGYFCFSIVIAGLQSQNKARTIEYNRVKYVKSRKKRIF
jgi:hypothetical protein